MTDLTFPVLRRRFGLDRSALIHGSRLAFAAWLSFSIASALHLGNAYWAAMPVWVVTQGAKGLLIERAFFRTAGTLAGAAFGFGILVLEPQPVLLLALLGLWVAVQATLVHLLRGVHGYGALLAGMTAAVIVLPSLGQSDHSVALDLALARLENTLIGVAVVTIVTGFFTPSSPRAAFYAGVRRLGRDAILFAAASIDGLAPAEAVAQERRLLRALSEGQANAVLVTAGSIEGYRRLHHLHALTVAAAGVMAAGRAAAQSRIAPLAVKLRALDALLDGAVPQRAAIEDLIAETAQSDSRLGRALGHLAEAEIALQTEPGGAQAVPFGPKPGYRVVRLDYHLAIEAGLIAGGATFVSGVIAVELAWAAAPLCALGVCIFSMVLGSLPAPERVAPVMLKGVVAGLAAALVYRFGLQPHIDAVPTLVASLAPFLLIGGWARASPKLGAPALDANMCFLLASQPVLPPVTDAAAIWSGTAALLLAAVIVAPVFVLLPARSKRETQHTRAALRDDLMRMLTLGKTLPPERQRARALQQILRLSLHVEQAAGLGLETQGSLLAALNLGEAIKDLKAAGEPGAPALALLRDFPNGPRTTADSLEALAAGHLEKEIRAAAVALRETGTLLRRSSW